MDSFQRSGYNYVLVGTCDIQFKVCIEKSYVPLPALITSMTALYILNTARERSVSKKNCTQPGIHGQIDCKLCSVSLVYYYKTDQPQVPPPPPLP
jgi:hypothetical protein